MEKLKEGNLIKKALLFVFLPWSLIGVLGCFFPFVYAFVPSSQGTTCICSFYQDMYTSGHDYFVVLHPGPGSNLYYEIILQINMTAFALLNWLFVTFLIIMVFSIRRVSDQTLTKKECRAITVLWFLSNVWQHYLNWKNNYSSCLRKYDEKELEMLMRATYWSIMARNFFTLLITGFYSFKLYWREQYAFADLGEANEATQDFVLQDFSLLLNSFVPRQCFEQYLTHGTSKEGGKYAYVQILKKIELYKVYVREMEDCLDDDLMSDDNTQIDTLIGTLPNLSQNSDSGIERGPKARKLERKALEKQQEAIELAFENKHLFKVEDCMMVEDEVPVTESWDLMRRSTKSLSVREPRESISYDSFRRNEANRSGESGSLVSRSRFTNEIKVVQPDDVNITRMTGNSSFVVLDKTQNAEYLQDIEYLYSRSYSELVEEWKNGFRASIYYKEMVLLLNQNIIEYRFMQ